MKINHTSWKSVALAVTVSLLMSGVALAGTFSISGHVFYCSNPALPPVPGVTMTLTDAGGGTTTTTTDASGAYTFSGLTSSGSPYTVMPSMAPRAPGSVAINIIDVIAIIRHFNLIGCRLTAADVNADGTINAIDVIAVERSFFGLSTGIANVGKYKFNPPVSPPIS